jgi:hypothetical protein
MNELITINGKEIQKIEYNGFPVVTTRMIACIHGKSVKQVNQQLKRNKNKLVINEEYFEIDTEELRKLNVAAISPMDRSKKSYLFTELGYLKFSHSFNDDVSSKIQLLTITCYFRTQDLKKNFLKEITPILTEIKELRIEIKELKLKTDFQQLKIESLETRMESLHENQVNQYGILRRINQSKPITKIYDIPETNEITDNYKDSIPELNNLIQEYAEIIGILFKNAWDVFFYNMNERVRYNCKLRSQTLQCNLCDVIRIDNKKQAAITCAQGMVKRAKSGITH